MNETIIKRLGNLLSVKSLVTLTLTVVFAVMALRGTISQDFMTIYAVIIAFYFGTQSQKVISFRSPPWSFRQRTPFRPVDTPQFIPKVAALSPVNALL